MITTNPANPDRNTQRIITCSIFASWFLTELCLYIMNVKVTMIKKLFVAFKFIIASIVIILVMIDMSLMVI